MHSRPDPTASASAPPVPGWGTGVTISLAFFLPVMVIVALSPAIPSMVAHFAAVQQAATLIPLLVTTPGLVVALFAPAAGVLVDRVGRRTPLLIATFAYALAGMAPILTDNLIGIGMARVCVGLCEAVILVAINALLADYFDADRRRFWLTVQSAGFPFLAAIMIVISGFLTRWVWNGAFLSYAVVIPIFVAILIFCKEPARPSHAETSAAAIADDRAFPWFATLAICLAALFASIMFYVYIVQVALTYAAIGVTDSARVGQFIAMSAIGLPPGAFLFYQLSRRLPAEAVLAVCLIIMGAGLALIGSARTPIEMLTGGVVQQVSAGMMISTLVLWLSFILPPQHRGRGFGLLNTASFGGQFISPLIVGAVGTATGGILATFVVLGGVAIVGGVTMAVLATRPLRPL